MLFSSALLVFALMSSLRDFHVSGCDYNCADKPVFTPSSLVVKHGDPTSATCVSCSNSCQNIVSGLEHSQGKKTENGTTLVWTVDRITEWDSRITCYYNGDKQCCTDLDVTVYQPPQHVSISFVDHTGSMLEGHQYQLQCTVENVAPVKHLVVTFYRGETVLDQLQSKSSERYKPVTETFTLNITARKEDNEAQYWCEAKLDLGPEGPQPPPVVTSGNITATVNYGPKLDVPANQNVKITRGDTLRLNCSSEANPSPSYSWKLPGGIASSFSGSVLIIQSVGSDKEGNYVCTTSNEVETVNVTFSVHVQYGPKLLVPANQNVKVNEGDTLRLDCSSEGNPSPSYSWKLPGGRASSSNSSVLIIHSVGFNQGGNYVCTTSNEVETVNVTFSVDVPPITLIIGLVVGCVLIVITAFVAYRYCYKPNRMGQYNMKVLKHMRHIPVPVEF